MNPIVQLYNLWYALSIKRSLGYNTIHALVAQWIERLRPKESVGGSIPSQGTINMQLYS